MDCEQHKTQETKANAREVRRKRMQVKLNKMRDEVEVASESVPEEDILMVELHKNEFDQ